MTSGSKNSSPSQPPHGIGDFDFLNGRWRVHNRRLRQPLTGATDWYEFDGHAEERSLWDGQANIEEFEAETPYGRIRGLALRLYRPEARQWTIHWSNAITGTLDPCMTGEFRNGRGEFYGRDTHEGRSVLLRFIWTFGESTGARWEQAFSDDGGATWETNWIMEFKRPADPNRAHEASDGS